MFAAQGVRSDGTAELAHSTSTARHSPAPCPLALSHATLRPLARPPCGTRQRVRAASAHRGAPVPAMLRNVRLAPRAPRATLAGARRGWCHSPGRFCHVHPPARSAGCPPAGALVPQGRAMPQTSRRRTRDSDARLWARRSHTGSAASRKGAYCGSSPQAWGTLRCLRPLQPRDLVRLAVLFDGIAGDPAAEIVGLARIKIGKTRRR
jgi:hypothetical protein